MPETAELEATVEQLDVPSTETSTEGIETADQTTVTQTETTDQGTQEETFFDPANIPEELKPAYKEMQRAFTKKTSSIKERQQHLAAYDAFMKNPVAEMQNLANQYGYSLTKAEAAQAVNDAQKDWQPQTWEEVIDKTKQETRAEILKEFEPMLQQFKSVKQSQIESQLDELVPEWRTYEDEMSEALTAHPTLANDPVKLARLAIPEEVLQGRAAQAAIKKFQEKAKATQTSGGSSTNKSAELTTPNKNLSFAESIAFAQKQLASGG
jgi:hypothetical protein